MGLLSARRRAAAWAAGWLLISGCATSSSEAHRPETDRELTLRRLRELEARQRRLEERLDAIDTRLQTLAKRLDEAVPKPPPDLEVVQLPPPAPATPYEAELDEYAPPVPESEEPVVIRLYGDEKPKRPPRTRVPKAAGVKALYKRARALYVAGRFAEAERAFATIYADHPKHDLADNALYWRGMCRLRLGRYPEAIEILREVPLRYPTSPKVPDALLAIGEAYRASGDEVSARIYFNQVVQQFPSSEAAPKAKAFLSAKGSTRAVTR